MWPNCGNEGEKKSSENEERKGVIRVDVTMTGPSRKDAHTTDRRTLWAVALADSPSDGIIPCHLWWQAIIATLQHAVASRKNVRYCQASRENVRPYQTARKSVHAAVQVTMPRARVVHPSVQCRSDAHPI